MMGPEYFTVAGYVGDGFIVCSECGEKAEMPAKDQLTVAQAESEFSDGGLYCDDCGKEIVEPYEEEQDDEQDETEE